MTLHVLQQRGQEGSAIGKGYGLFCDPATPLEGNAQALIYSWCPQLHVNSLFLSQGQGYLQVLLIIYS